jgi:hypothetical protein
MPPLEPLELLEDELGDCRPDELHPNSSAVSATVVAVQPMIVLIVFLIMGKEP